MTAVEFFYDVSSPWTYFASRRIQQFCATNQVELVWKPFLVGGVFNKVNPSVYERRENPVPPKDNYYQKDMRDWARYFGIDMIKPSVFPLNSVKALRGAFVAIEAGVVAAYSEACFNAYWVQNRDISQVDELRAVAIESGLEPDAFFEAIGQPDIKQKLFDTTDELIERGGFGSPTFFLNGDDMYFGNDRIELMQAALDRG